MSLNTQSIFVWILIIIFYHVLYTKMDLETCTRRLYKNVPWKVYSSRLQGWTMRDVYYRPMYKDGAGDNTSCMQGWTWRRVHVLNTMMDLETCSRPVYMASLGNFYSSCIQGWTWRRLLVLYTRRWTWRRLLVLYARMDLKTCTRPVYKDGPGDVHSSCIQGLTWRRLLVLYAVWTRRPVLTSTSFSSSWHLILPRLSLKWN